MSIKVGQIYEESEGMVYIISYITMCNIHLFYNNGYTTELPKTRITDITNYDKLIAEYDTWLDAVNSKEFKGEKHE